MSSSHPSESIDPASPGGLDPEPGTPGPQSIRLREKVAYGLGDMGSNLVYAPATAFILFYLTNVAGIGAAIAGTILLVGQLLNGITDIAIGALIDKTSTRWGKVRPWVLGTALPLAGSFVMLFSVPTGLDETGRVIWALIAYTLVMAVFFTANNVAYSALMSVMTPNPRARVTLTAFRFFTALLTTLVVNAITLPIIGALGNGSSAWTTTATIYGVISVLTMVIVFLGTKERLSDTGEAHETAKQPLRVLLRNLARNRYFFLAALLFIVFNLTTGLSSAAGVYYAADVLGDQNLFGLLSLAGILPALIGIPFMPALIGRYGKRPLFLIGVGVMIVGSILPLLDPTDLTIALTGLIVRGVGMVPLTAGNFAIVADVVDYGEWKFGIRSDGLIYSSVSLGQKIGSGFGAAIVGWVLAAGGYAVGADDQSAASTQSVIVAYIYLPLIAVILTGVVVFFFRIERHGLAIQAFLADRAAERDGRLVRGRTDDGDETGHER